MATIEEEQLAQLLAQQEGFGFSPRENIYGSIGSGIASALPKMVNPYGSTGSNIATVLGGSLVAGLLGYQARQEAEERNKALMPVFTNVLGAKDMPALTSALSGVDPDIARKLTPYVLQQATTLRAQEAAQAKAQAEEARKMRIFEQQQDIIQKGKLELAENKFAARQEAEEAKKAQRQENLEKLKATQQQADKLNPNVLSLPEMETAAFERYSGMTTPGALAGMVTKATEIERKTALTELKANNEQNQLLDNLEKIIGQAEVAVRGAGETGGPGAVNYARKLVKQYGQYFDKKLEEQVAFESNFRPIMAEMVKLLRSPGAVSNLEFTLLGESGPSADNRKPQNLQLLKQMKAHLKHVKRRSRFVEEYYRNMGHLIGVRDVLNLYEKNVTQGRNYIDLLDVDLPEIAPWAKSYFGQQRERSQPINQETATELQSRNPGIKVLSGGF